MRISVHMAALAATLLSACAQPQLSPDEQNALAPVACRGAEQCARMWQRAHIWLANNSRHRIQMSNDTVITTFGGLDNSDAKTGFSITKSPISGDLYEIDSRAGCPNMFGCFPPPNKARAALHRYLRETPQ